ncbi:MAG: hypothetical protein WD451_11840 [Thermoanaerobaculia bacterium]
MDEQTGAIGFLGSDGALYCSRACALRQGTDGDEVDQEEYESLLEGDSLQPGSLCPVCGGEFPVSWPDRQPD